MLDAQGALWAALSMGFFALAHAVARATGLSGLGDCGYRRRRGALRAGGLGLAVGAGLWLALSALEFATGALRPLEPRPPDAIAWVVVQALVVAVLGSATNDLGVRGYLLAQLRGRVPAAVAIAVSAVAYTVDDFALGGFTLRNALFSLLLGAALALAAVRRGDLWLSSGLHVGLDLVYWLMHRVGGVGVLRLERGAAPPGLAWAGVFAAGLMLAWVAWTTRSHGPIDSAGRAAPEPVAPA